MAEEDGRLPTILDVIAHAATCRWSSTRRRRARARCGTRPPSAAAAVAEGILCLTSIDTAIAAARSLEPDARAGIADVRPLGEWMPAGALPSGRVAAPSV